ncbi:MAG: glycosyltransferase family 4 protein [Candidatus Aenigmarchaeota archaeon]|nr:glycosyltransferase family 4 protein [Candidatus Aenigmarchaeota archaeon]
MKVAYLALSEKFGDPHAGFVHTHEMARAIARKGVKIKLLIQKGDTKTKPSVETIFLPARGASKYFFYKKIIEPEIADCDLVHERFHANPVTLGMIKNRKYVLEVNDPGIVKGEIKGRLYSYLIGKKLRRADAIITQTSTLKSILEKKTNRPIFVVPNGVDTSRFRPGIKSDIRERLGIKKGDILIAYAGSFREWHGVEQIPYIASRILRKHSNVRVVLIGEGMLFDRTKAACKGEKNIMFTGGIAYNELPEYLSASDVLIAPFDVSGYRPMEKYGFWWCPVKLFEYMASGRPVVSYDFPEVRKIVRDAGLLAGPGDVDGFSEKLTELIKDRSLRERLGRRARAIAEEYDWKKRARSIITIYNKLV